MALAQLHLIAIAIALCLPLLASPSPLSLSFPLFHKDSPSSPFHISSLQQYNDIPLHTFLALTQSLRTTRMKHKPTTLVRGRFSYLNEIVGDFYLHLPIGSPPQLLIFTLDTGSELTWTQCSPCLHCNHTGAPLFHSSNSSTYHRLSCTSPLCSHSLGFNKGCSSQSPASCLFQLQYGEGSTDAGYLSVDVFRFGKLRQPFVFGCAEIDIETVPSPVSGIMGLSAGPYSFASQLLSGGYPKKFAYCLPDRLTNLTSSGMIVFGESSPPKLMYTPLIPPLPPLADLYYYIGLSGISLGSRLLEIPASAFKYHTDGSGGTVLDSGTAITHFVESAYKPLIEALNQSTTHLKPFAVGGAGDVCYRIPITATQLPNIPPITFHFMGGVDLELEANSILYPAEVDGNNIILCAAFASSGAIPLNIVGNYQQQNYWIEYDLELQRVGFAKTNCAIV